MTRVSIVGGSGYTGGDLLRLLLFHPNVTLAQVTSRGEAGRYVHAVHPNLRGVTELQFTHPDALEPCDVLFLALPHGTAAREIERWAALAPVIIDLSADFRLKDAAAYQRWYGEAHPAPAWLTRFVYGLPEVNRDQLRGARWTSGVGCNATVVNLALWPLAQAGLLHRADAALSVGSSEGGAEPVPGSHHPIRSGAVRTYSPANHRHLAEVQQVLGAHIPVHFTVTAVEMVRGVHLVAQCELTTPQTEKDVWRLYRAAYSGEPFIRLVSSRTGLHRFPEPRIVAGTNFCDIGFALDGDGSRLIVIAALDNLGKGAAGSAVQCMNLMLGFDERAGLSFPGYYP
ncbi:MAG: N-acetyl-gamma-glutamyl-phosphate reductase [Aggregatilineales bacterium]